MPADPKCSAIASALANKGYSYAQLAKEINSNEPRVTAICTGNAQATETEFNSIAKALGMSNSVPHVGKHQTA